MYKCDRCGEFSKDYNNWCSFYIRQLVTYIICPACPNCLKRAVRLLDLLFLKGGDNNETG